MCGSMARIDALATLCDERGVMLIEDAAQALGGHYGGKALGTFGKAGCFSFDYVKTITCGEGGAVITDDKDVYDIIQAYTDHGHDHVGSDRGAEGHPHIGTNYRISELNAAVGVAQLRKLDGMLEVQRANKAYIKDGLTGLNRVSFRELPDPDGDSATFLSFFMPTEEEARQATKDLAAAGVDGCFYWYDNNWHYHRRWEHLKQMNSPGALAPDRLGYGENWANRDLAKSDAIMGRTICMLIKLSWDETALAERLEKMKSVLG
jgi:8-amino-3,8-dideoxy-alpha-D-manno-octulosonate transaminase